MRKLAALPLIALAALLGSAFAAPAAVVVPPSSARIELEPGVVAVLSYERGLGLEAVPRRGEGLYAFTRRFCGDDRLSPQLREANGDAAELLAGIRYRVPFQLLTPDWQLRVARALFPNDAGQADGWKHEARGAGPFQRESLWQLSEWFTGTGENFRAIREYNQLVDDDVGRGTAVVIPSELLRPSFRTALPVAEKPFDLDYGKDEGGEYAVYRLRPGEALYSSVVVRFTGRVFAVDVNALAAEIAGRNGIHDVTDIPIGYRVKIPLDLLQPEFLPEGHARRKEYEESLRASAHFSNKIRSRGLSGITVVLDPGHGGPDAGTSAGGVWESLYVYDVTLRVKRILETQTAARVQVTTRDGDDFRIHDADVLPFSRSHVLLTTPPYRLEDSTAGVNLRWYLANSLYRRAVREDRDPQKVVFLSIHADSLHPSLRGVMAYIPGAEMRGDRYSKSGSVYAARKEYQESPSVTFTREQRVESEGLSRELAKQVIASFQAAGLPVHPFKPVRDRIIRNKSAWVPAVLRYNSIPAKILLEVCNLANGEDRKLIQTRAYRQRVAEAIVQGLLAYYGEGSGPSTPQIAASAK